MTNEQRRKLEEMSKALHVDDSIDFMAGAEAASEMYEAEIAEQFSDVIRRTEDDTRFRIAEAVKAESKRRCEWMEGMLERAKDLIPELGVTTEIPKDDWTNHPAISYRKIQVEKSSIEDATKWLADLAAGPEKKGKNE